MATKTVLFIHGNFVNYESWNPWVARYEAKGYKCIAVAYPMRDKPVAELRRIHPDPRLGTLTIKQVIDHHVSIIKGLDELPIIVGHSFGGMLTQVMVNRGLAAAAVAIDSVPVMGVLSYELSFYRSTWPLFNPLHLPSRPWLMPFKHYQYAFDNGTPLEEQRRGWEESIVPESIRLGRGGIGPQAKVDFKKAHPPLLLIGGENDHIMPAALNRRNYRRYKASPSVTEYKEFPGRNHFSVIAGKGWEEVADYALDWATSQLVSPSSNGRKESKEAVPVRG